jgi:hypothetical protein
MRPYVGESNKCGKADMHIVCIHSEFRASWHNMYMSLPTSPHVYCQIRRE